MSSVRQKQQKSWGDRRKGLFTTGKSLTVNGLRGVFWEERAEVLATADGRKSDCDL